MEYVAVVFAITAGVIGLAGRLPDPRKVKRELARARIQPIRTLADGAPAVVRGTVALVDDATFVVSPLGDRNCVYWLVVYDEVGIGGDYAELGRVEGTCSFLLRSDDGTARIAPDHPRIALPGRSFSQPISVLAQTPYNAMTELARRVCRKPNYPTSWLRVTEYTIEPGQFLTISGWCTREPDPEASVDVSGYREQLPTRPVISGSRRARLLIG